MWFLKFLQNIYQCMIPKLSFVRFCAKDVLMLLEKSLIWLISYLSSLVTLNAISKPPWLKYTGCFKCPNTRCFCCRYLRLSHTFISSVTNKVYPIKQYINCDMAYVVYLATCNECSIQYVSSTMCNA